MRRPPTEAGNFLEETRIGKGLSQRGLSQQSGRHLWLAVSCQTTTEGRPWTTGKGTEPWRIIKRGTRLPLLAQDVKLHAHAEAAGLGREDLPDASRGQGQELLRFSPGSLRQKNSLKGLGPYVPKYGEQMIPISCLIPSLAAATRTTLMRGSHSSFNAGKDSGFDYCFHSREVDDNSCCGCYHAFSRWGFWVI